MHSHLVHLPGRDGPHTPELLHLEPGDEIQRLRGVDGAKPVRLAVVRSHLGQELVVGNPGGSHQVQLLTDAPLDLAGDIHRQRYSRLVLRHVQESLVQRNRLDKVCIQMENLMNLTRHGLVGVHPPRHENQAGTQPQGPLRRHGRTHPEAAGLVAGRGHHAPLLRTAHGNGLAPEFRMVALLHRRIKRVHVDVYDFPLRVHVSPVPAAQDRNNWC